MGRACIERAFGSSSAKPAKRVLSRRASSAAIAKDSAASPQNMGGNSTAPIPG